MPASLSQTCEPKEDTRYERHCYSLIWPSSMEKNHIIQIWCGKFKEKIFEKKTKKIDRSKNEGCLEIIKTSNLSPLEKLITKSLKIHQRIQPP